MGTQLIRNLYNILPHHRGGVATIGNFDGVHLGHKILIDKVKERAKTFSGPSIVITFEPQPLEFFARFTPDTLFKVARLSRFREKFFALAATGVDYVLVLHFNERLAALRPEAFVEDVLVKGLQIKHVVVGSDFRFGAKRAGDFALLKKIGTQKNFGVESIDRVDMNDERISSTRVRQALARGDHQGVQALLGHPYTMMGRVTHGNKLGRKLGFPTANIYLHRAVTPVQGIYVVRMFGIDKEPLKGVANVGIRPTVGGTRSLLEVHLLDFDRDIYGRQVTVEFLKKLREEVRFENLELLKEAIAVDVEVGRKYFEGLREEKGWERS